MEKLETTRVPVTSLAKALQVLDSFTTDQPEQGVTEISRRLGLHKSTVHNILTTFEMMQYVEQDRDTRRYRLGFRLLQLSNVVREGLGMRKVALSMMEKARDIYQETIHLTVEQDGEVVYLESVQPSDRSVARLAVGKRAKMHCTGVGKVILAFMPDAKVDEITNRHGMTAYTAHTITSLQELQKEFHFIRQHGFAVDNMEHEWGIRCIAVPIRNERGQVIASMSVSGPSERLPLDTINESAQPLVELGMEVSRRLGWMGY